MKLPPNNPVIHEQVCALVCATGAKRIKVDMNYSPRKWWHNLSLHIQYARDWAGVIK